VIRAIRWLCRLGALLIIAAIWYLLPDLMHGYSRPLAMFLLVCLVVAADSALVALLVSLIPYKKPSANPAILQQRGKDQQREKP